MGLNNRIIRLLDHARQSGVDFDSTVMIGRQQVHLDKTDFCKVATDCELAEVQNLADELFGVADRYAEPLLKALGATTVDSVDASDYEDANIVTDLNQPIDTNLHGQYSCVIDGGSLEHVFHFPTAIKNCMQMTRVGGHFISVNGTNNFSGHGFYQFSPELMYRVLSPENGFEVCDMFIWERFEGSRLYRVADPAEVRSRVMPLNHHPTFLLVVAKRTSEAEIFAQTPQQSDYTVDWAQGAHREPGVVPMRPPLLKRVGKQAEKKVREMRHRLFSQFRSEHFEPFDLRRRA